MEGVCTASTILLLTWSAVLALASKIKTTISLASTLTSTSASRIVCRRQATTAASCVADTVGEETSVTRGRRTATAIPSIPFRVSERDDPELA